MPTNKVAWESLLKEVKEDRSTQIRRGRLVWWLYLGWGIAVTVAAIAALLYHLRAERQLQDIVTQTTADSQRLQTKVDTAQKEIGDQIDEAKRDITALNGKLKAADASADRLRVQLQD